MVSGEWLPPMRLIRHIRPQFSPIRQDGPPLNLTTRKPWPTFALDCELAPPPIPPRFCPSFCYRCFVCHPRLRRLLSRSLIAGITRPRPGPPQRERRQFTNSHDDLSPEAQELAQAIDSYKLMHRRRFITYEEMLAVMKSLGYKRN